VRIPFIEVLHFDSETGKLSLTMDEGRIWPGKRPLPLRRMDGSYDTAICTRYDNLMEQLQQIAKTKEVVVIFYFCKFCLHK